MRERDFGEVLASFKKPWKAELQARLLKGSPSVQSCVGKILDFEEPDSNLVRTRELYFEQERAIFSILSGFSTSERIETFGILFPAFPEALEAAWIAFKKLPYMEGPHRRVFRAPENFSTALRAGHWLINLWRLTREYPYDLHWFAVWAGRLPSAHRDEMGWLFAGVLNKDPQLFDLLKLSATGEHEIGIMGRHIVRACLTSDFPEAWTFIEGFLLAAQRQEGLQQVIFETIDEAHPEAFKHMLALILDQDLLRFSSAVRAVNGWLGWAYEVDSRKEMAFHLKRFLKFLSEPETRQLALREGNAMETHLALWALAFYDAPQTFEDAAFLIEHPDAEKRLAFAHFVSSSALPDRFPYVELLLADSDLRVASLAIPHRWLENGSTVSDGIFKALIGLAQRLPPEPKKDMLLFPWACWVASKASALSLLPAFLGDRPVGVLSPYLKEMDPMARTQVADLLSGEQELTPDLRNLSLNLLKDSSWGVRETALAGLKKRSIGIDDALILEDHLSRKGSDLRRASMELLLQQSRVDVLSSVKRLLEAKKTEQRQAGLEILNVWVQSNDGHLDLSPILERFTAKNTAESEWVQRLTHPIADLTLENGLGLFDPEKLTPVPTVHWIDRPYLSERWIHLLKELDGWIAQHQRIPVQTGVREKNEEVFGNISPWEFIHQIKRCENARFPLEEVWTQWWINRPDPLPEDALALRFLLRHFQEIQTYSGASGAPPVVSVDVHHSLLFATERLPCLKHVNLAQAIVEVLHLRQPEAAAAGVDFLLDTFESQLSLLDVQGSVSSRSDPRDNLRVDFHFFETHRDWHDGQLERVWKLCAYMSRGLPKPWPVRHVSLEILLAAFRKGFANVHDFMHLLIGPRTRSRHGGAFHELRKLSSKKPHRLLEQYPEVKPFVERACERILESEIRRADLDTPATEPACCVQHVRGMKYPLTMLSQLGKTPLFRGDGYVNHSKSAVFGHLIRVSCPAPEDTPEGFSALVHRLGLSTDRLLELAMYAPQWSDCVAGTLDWPGLKSAVYWFHTHTKDRSWGVNDSICDAWEAEISEYTPLKPQELLEGAVDVAWFKVVYGELGSERFSRLSEASQCASNLGGHKRATLFAQAILGQCLETQLELSIDTARNQDSVRALGLLPLQEEHQLQHRYEVIQKFLESRKQFGAQRRASEELAGTIALQNLARTAGYSDPNHLMWTLEAQKSETLAEKSFWAENLNMKLWISEAGEVQSCMSQQDKIVKKVPKSLKKHSEVQAFCSEKERLIKLRTRMQEVLEKAMIRGDFFESSDLQKMLFHPLLKPMLERLVWVDSEGALGWIRAGELPFPKALRIAHPNDLFTQGRWQDWQKQCIEEQLKQPFEQIFREYYVLTAAERTQQRSFRYHGHQVNPRQTFALLQSRDWVSCYPEGIRKTFHREGLSAWVEFQEGTYTPSEIRGLTLDSVFFTKKGGFEPLDLCDIPPRLFSEVLRDVNLVVGVAHIGGEPRDQPSAP